MCIEPFENVCILGDFNDRNQTCVDSPSFKRWKELGRLMLASGVRCFSKDGITFRRNLVTERSVLDLSFDPTTVTREVSYATYVSQGNMRHKHFGTDHSKCFFRKEVAANRYARRYYTYENLEIVSREVEKGVNGSMKVAFISNLEDINRIPDMGKKNHDG